MYANYDEQTPKEKFDFKAMKKVQDFLESTDHKEAMSELLSCILIDDDANELTVYLSTKFEPTERTECDYICLKIPVECTYFEEIDHGK